VTAYITRRELIDIFLDKLDATRADLRAAYFKNPESFSTGEASGRIHALIEVLDLLDIVHD